MASKDDKIRELGKEIRILEIEKMELASLKQGKVDDDNMPKILLTLSSKFLKKEEICSF